MPVAEGKIFVSNGQRSLSDHFHQFAVVRLAGAELGDGFDDFDFARGAKVAQAFRADCRADFGDWSLGSLVTAISFSPL